MTSTKICFALPFFALCSIVGRSQETDEITALRAEIAELRQLVEELRKECVTLRTELEASHSSAAPKAANLNSLKLSDRLSVGLRLEGDYQSSQLQHLGRFLLTIDSRDGNKLVGTGEVIYDGSVLHTGEYQGIINNNKLVLVRQGSGKKVRIEFVFKDDALEGSFVDMQGNKGTIGLLFPSSTP